MIRRIVGPAAVVGLGLLTACTDDDDVRSTANSTTTSSTVSSSATAGSATTGRSSRQAVVTSDGGLIEVTGDSGKLVVVDLSPSEGWEVAVEPSGDDRLRVVFTTEGRQTEVIIVLTADGISSSTRSTSGG